MRLSPKGMIRWHTSCCHAPFGNMMASQSMTFIGLPLSGFKAGAEEHMGPLRASMFAKFARQGSQPCKDFGLFPVMFRILKRHFTSKFRAKTRATPFWENGSPISAPRILTLEERKAVTPE